MSYDPCGICEECLEGIRCREDPEPPFIIVRLDDPTRGGGPGVVLEVTHEGPEALRRYDGRDGAHLPDLRFWRGWVGIEAGDRVELGRPS